MNKDLKRNLGSHFAIKGDILDYINIYLLIGFSGIAFFMSNRLLLVMFFIFLIIQFVSKKLIINKFVYQVAILLLLLFFSQYTTFQFFSISSFLSLFIYYGVAYFTIKLAGWKFTKLYTDIIYVLAILGLVFYVASLISIRAYQILVEIPEFLELDPWEGRNFLLYTTESSITSTVNIRRNAGFVYEPGFYACLLVLAIIFNLFQENNLLNRKSVIYIISLLTTFSTAGYIVISFLVIGYLVITPNIKSKIILVPILIIISIYGFINLAFMDEKISDSVEDSGYYRGEEYYENKGRIGSALVDTRDILKYPLFGRGRNRHTRYDVYESAEDTELSHRSNGFTDFIVEFGIPFSIYYYYYIFYSFKVLGRQHNRNKYIAYLAFFSIIVIGQSQTIFMRPIFLALFFLNVVYAHKPIRIRFG